MATVFLPEVLGFIMEGKDRCLCNSDFGGNTIRQIQLMHDFGSTVLACTPSYALFLAEAIQESGINRDDLKLRVGVFGAEPWKRT